jgi:Zn-dependent protease with chaperone function
LVIVGLSLLAFYAIDRLQGVLMPWSRRNESR